MTPIIRGGGKRETEPRSPAKATFYSRPPLWPPDDMALEVDHL